MPHDTRVKIRRFFRKSKRLFKRKSYDALVSECLSQALQRDVRYQIASGVFMGVWWLSEQVHSREFLEDLSVKVRLRPSVHPAVPPAVRPSASHHTRCCSPLPCRCAASPTARKTRSTRSTRST